MQPKDTKSVLDDLRDPLANYPAGVSADLIRSGKSIGASGKDKIGFGQPIYTMGPDGYAGLSPAQA